jgi:hypothetical protein
MDADMDFTPNGYGIAGIWRGKANHITGLLVCAMTHMPAEEAMEIAWQYAKEHVVKAAVPSKHFNMYSVIKTKLKQKAYTNKKGVAHEDKYEDAHFTQGGVFLDWASKLGTKPVSYDLPIRVRAKNFRFIHNTEAKTMRDFFQHTSFADVSDVEVYDPTKKECKDARKAKAKVPIDDSSDVEEDEE